MPPHNKRNSKSSYERFNRELTITPISSSAPIVYIIEDNAFLSKLLKKKLEDEGFVSRVFIDGQEGLDALAGDPPDLILLDLILPKVDGFEVLKHIKETPVFKDVPVLILSNLGQNQDVNRGLKLGATAYFVKSDVGVHDLVKEIKKRLSRS